MDAATYALRVNLAARGAQLGHNPALAGGLERQRKQGALGSTDAGRTRGALI